VAFVMRIVHHVGACIFAEPVTLLLGRVKNYSLEKEDLIVKIIEKK
jgi:hypothetical protein